MARLNHRSARVVKRAGIIERQLAKELHPAIKNDSGAILSSENQAMAALCVEYHLKRLCSCSALDSFASRSELASGSCFSSSENFAMSRSEIDQ